MIRDDGMEYFNLRMVKELFLNIEEFAYEHRIRSRASAVRHLIATGLRSYGYEIAEELEHSYTKRGAAARSDAVGLVIPTVDSEPAA